MPTAVLLALIASYASAQKQSTPVQYPIQATQREGASNGGPADFAPLHFITSDPNYSDYRPAIDSVAQHVVFERTPAGGGTTQLYILSMDRAVPQPFIQHGQGTDINAGPSQTRPDWSWITGNVVLNVAATGEGQVEILIAAANGIPMENVPHSKGFVYPTWSPDGTQLIVYNDSPDAEPRPSTSLIALDGTLVQDNLDGNDANNVPIFGGFASPTPGNTNLIAYAGQPDMAWAAAATSNYNQDFNYVFLNSNNGGVFSSSPLEPDASVLIYNQSYQGRAPVWSPDGNYVAFESNRNGGYAIFLANVATGGAPVQVTDARYGAQHAKFFPDGTRIILTALQVPGADGPRGIAWVDISQFLHEARSGTSALR
jgi:hypothetical protein